MPNIMEIEEDHNCIINHQEWLLWKQCLGKVIIINGTSSAGKSTIAHHLCKFGFKLVSQDEIFDQILLKHLRHAMPSDMHPVMDIISFNDIKKIIWNFKVNKEKYDLEEIDSLFGKLELSINEAITRMPTWQQMFEQIKEEMYDESAPYIFSGRNVIIDTVLVEDREISHLSYHFRYYPFSILLLYTSLDRNLDKCFLRNDRAIEEDSFDFRAPEIILNNYMSLYKGVKESELKLFENEVIKKFDKPSFEALTSKIISKAAELFNYLYDQNSLQKAIAIGDIISSDINEVKNAIQKTNMTFALSDISDIYLVPTIKYDYFICLDEIEKELIGSINFSFLLE